MTSTRRTPRHASPDPAPLDPASVANEFTARQIALVDFALKSGIASMARVAAVVRGEA